MTSQSSSSNSNQTKIKIIHHPTNSNGPHQISCLHSDATQSTWPAIGPCPTSIKTSTSWDSIDLNSKISNKWLSILGKGLADSLGLIKCTQKEDWKLTNFPENYQLFNYIKGSLQDQYLFGSSHVRKFRTANEFLPHLQWLATSNSTITCQCKYCAGTKSQTETNSNYTNHSQPTIQRSKPTNSKRKAMKALNRTHELTSPEDSSQEIVKKRPSKKFKVTGTRSSSEVPAILASNDSRSELNSIDSRQVNYHGPYLSKDLKRDLMTDRSNFREYELVWCNIEDEFIGNKDSNSKNQDRFDLDTKYWPGLCEEMVLETQACITIDDDEEGEEENEKSKKRLDKHSNRKSNETLINSNNQKALVVKRPKNKRLKVDLSKGTSTSSSFTKMKSEQKFYWKIRLLGLEEIIKREESSILPWLFQPFKDIKEKFNLKNSTQQNLSNYLIERQQECKRPMLDNFTCVENAKLSFLLALQIGANLEESWSTSDPYDLQTDEGEDESEELIRRPTMIHKAQVNEINGLMMKKIPETWYQSVWWGAEKIWIFDTVRLNKVESDLPMELFKNQLNSKLNFNHIDSNDKAYFLKIDGIYRDEIEETIILIGKVYDLVSVSSFTPKKSLPNHKPNAKPKPSIVVVIDDDDDEEEEEDKTKSRSTPKITKLSNEPILPTIPEDSSDTSFKYLPIPPKGYKFRQLTPFGESHHVHLNCIAGRYYSPAIKNRSDKLSNYSKRFLSKISSNAHSNSTSNSNSTSDSKSGILGGDHWESGLNGNGNHSTTMGKPKDLQRQNSSLFGLTAGRWNFMKCTKWKVNRMKSIMESERLAEEEMIKASSMINGSSENELKPI